MHISPLILAAQILKLTPLLQVAAVLDAGWEESKHPRKANGQFGSGGTTSSHECGGTSGALNDKNDPDWQRRDAHAKIFYEARRKNGLEAFVDKIHKNTGYSKKRLESVYKHVFINEYDLANGHCRFHPSFEMAQSFQRLLEGENIQPHDILMLKHEHLEFAIMHKLGYNYDKAHNLANTKYNYSKAEKEWRERNVDA